jgi:ribonuclease BN (tRNA processing enzyme)
VRIANTVDRVELHLLGSGDAFGSGGRFQTCFLLRGDSGALLIDCGASSLAAMKRSNVDPSEIGWVVLSHLHGDHFGGLPFLILDGQFSRRTLPLVIAGPAGVARRIEESLELFFPGSSRIARRFPVEFIELADRVPSSLGPFQVIPFPVLHPSGAPSYALRIEYQGKILAYSGDTEWTETLLDVARDADLFLCEAYFFEKKIPYHLDYRTLSQNRHRLKCRRLLMTHMSREMLDRLKEVEIEVASDGQVVGL